MVQNNHLRDDAGAKVATVYVGINGSRGLKLMLGSVGRDGEERRKEIHCGVCGVEVEYNEL